jgi:hypothetical protein
MAAAKLFAAIHAPVADPKASADGKPVSRARLLPGVAVSYR